MKITLTVAQIEQWIEKRIIIFDLLPEDIKQTISGMRTQIREINSAHSFTEGSESNLESKIKAEHPCKGEWKNDCPWPQCECAKKEFEKIQFKKTSKESYIGRPTKTITLEELILSAPGVPQDWFEPIIKGRPEFPRNKEDNKYLIDPNGPEWMAIKRKQLEWDTEYKKQMYIQWPRAWAIEQMKHLNETHFINHTELESEKQEEVNLMFGLLCRPQINATWKKGNDGSSIVSDLPSGIINPEMLHEYKESLDYYGGYLVAESLTPKTIEYILALHKREQARRKK